jgi:chromosome segregation ATPase
MRNFVLPIAALCLVLSSASVGSAAQQGDCTKILEVRTVDLGTVKSDLSSDMQKLSVVKGCALDFDEAEQAVGKIENLEGALQGVIGKIKSLEQELGNVIEVIQKRLEFPGIEPVETNFNALLAERLAYRGQVKTWPLRTSQQVISLENELAKITADIVALQKRIDAVSDWQDQAVLDDLVAQETKLTQALAEVQTRLTALEQKRANPKYAAAKQFEAEGPQRASALEEAVDGVLKKIEQLEQDIVSEKTSTEAAEARIQDLDEKVAMLREQFEALKANQSTSTAGLATAQIEKNRLSPISQDLTLRETILSTELKRLIPQSEATQSVVDQLSFNVSEKTAQITQLDSQITIDTESLASLQRRVDEANQNITSIRSQMSNGFKPLLEFQNVNNQVFALELTIDGLDNEIDNLDMRASGAEGKLNRFIRACKREPACKSALNL